MCTSVHYIIYVIILTELQFSIQSILKSGDHSAITEKSIIGILYILVKCMHPMKHS